MKKAILVILLFLSTYQTFSQSVLYDSILINSQLPRRFSLSLLSQFGFEPDSIINAKPMDQYEPDQYIYIGSSLFWYYKKQDICEAHRISFDKITCLKLGSITINETTSFEELKEHFFIDCDHFKLYSEKGDFNRCSIPVKDKTGHLWDLKIILIFKDQKVYRIDFWEPM